MGSNRHLIHQKQTSPNTVSFVGYNTYRTHFVGPQMADNLAQASGHSTFKNVHKFCPPILKNLSRFDFTL
jgi:hypothetical protein